MNNDFLWQTKLHARLHDPAEKAFVLLNDPNGHNNGTSRALHRDLGFHALPAGQDVLQPDNDEVLDTVLFKDGIPIEMYKLVKRADWWAAGADRPQWPVDVVQAQDGGQTVRIVDWARVDWSKRPILIHPLTGKSFDLRNLEDVDISDLKQRSYNHFSRLIVKNGENVDWRRTLLAFWRFGPELREAQGPNKLGQLRPLLPADTRVPDHSIWDHLDLASAFAGAFAADPQRECALLLVSLAPVQPFITAARKMEDVWAGSHLLARLSWEAMKPVCERLGPDAILFPRLRQIPLVDLWLRDEMGLPKEWFAGCPWTEKVNDTNPLFTAALPNRFVAVAPAHAAKEIAEEATARVRGWLLDKGLQVVDRLLEEAGLKAKDAPRDESCYAYAQMRRQLQNFPEVHWAAVPFSLIRPRHHDSQTDLDVSALADAMAPFWGVPADESCIAQVLPVWPLLNSHVQLDGQAFFAPRPGVLYPAIFELTERVVASVKSVREFSQSEEKGWRDTIGGENEWLTHDPKLLELPPGKRKSRKDADFREGEHHETLWTKIAGEKPAWAKPGEHLGALSAIKRLWPTLFAEEVARATGQDSGQAQRFVVSTHTMALAHQLDRWLAAGAPMPDELKEKLQKADGVPLPRKLAREHGWRDTFRLAKRIPELLESARESENESESRQVEKLIKKAFKDAFQGKGDMPEQKEVRLETYYALLLMDGDRMGRILSGDPEYAISYLESFHPEVRAGFQACAAQLPALQQYGQQKRALSPNRHLAISAALNDFSLHVVPEIVELEHLGRLLYAGGEDVFAMLPAADVLSAMRRLRRAYSGHDPADESVDWKDVPRAKRLVLKEGFAYLRGRLMRMMGERATISCGVVIAHHQAPLGYVRRMLHEAEQRAKNEGGRDAFSITVIKRSGGTLSVTAKWGEPLDLLLGLRNFLADPAVSRRAVFNSLAWLKDLPSDASAEMLSSLLAYQLRRQTAWTSAWEAHDGPDLARRLASLAVAQKDRFEWLERFMGVAEFLARELRSGDAREENTAAQAAA